MLNMSLLFKILSQNAGKLKTFIKLIKLNHSVPIIHTSSYSSKKTVYKNLKIK